MAKATTMKLPADKKTPLKIAAIIAVILGVLALVLPFMAGIAATFILATNFVIGGILMTIAAFNAKRGAGALGLMIVGIVSVLAGIFIFGHPLVGLVTITLFCIAGMFIAGIAKIFWVFKLPAGNGGRAFLLISGILSIVVAAMLYSNFPFTALWMFGVLVGINLVVEGISLWVFTRD